MKKRKKPLSDISYHNRLRCYDADVNQARRMLDNTKQEAEREIEEVERECRHRVMKIREKVGDARRDYNRAVSRRRSFLKFNMMI